MIGQLPRVRRQGVGPGVFERRAKKTGSLEHSRQDDG